MLHIQEYLQTKTPEDLKNELDINFKAYDDRIIFKYTMKSPKYNKIIKECRGIILSLPDYNVMARGFDRFYNFSEGNDCETFNWDNCIIFNKLDGSCLKCFNDGNKWCVSTNGTAFAEGTTPMGKTYHDLFVEAIGMDLQEAFDGFNTSLTFIFELTSPENRIVTKYNKTSATLLAIRDNKTGKYSEYDRLDKFVKYNADKFGLCESYDINNEKDLKEFVEGRNPLDEGCVLYDVGTQMRIKMKSSSYVSIHHLRGNDGATLKSILTLLIKGEMDEYLTYFGTDLPIMKPYIDKYNQLKLDIIKSYMKFESIKNQKEFALNIKDIPYKSFLFGLRKGLNFDDMFTLDNLNQLVKYFEKE